MGGQVEKTDSTLVVRNANSATIYISIGTNFKNYKDLSGDAEQMAESYLKEAGSEII